MIIEENKWYVWWLFHQHFFTAPDVYLAFLGLGNLLALKVKPRTFVVSLHSNRMYAFGCGQFHNATLEDICCPAGSDVGRSLAVGHCQYALRGDILEGVLL